MKNGSSSILSDLNEIKILLNGLLSKSLSGELNELFEKVSAEKFYLVILGLFKRGKSSFINSLLGEIVVPSGVVPLTAIITLIEYGEERSAEIFFEDGHSQKVKPENVNDFIAEELNPNNVKKVLKVVIYNPSDLLKYVTIIDTPGVGSSLEHNTQTTLKFVNKIDAALFILSTDIPITQLEVDFLKKLRGIVPEIIFVLNKIDILQQKELDELVRYDHNVLKDICNREYKFYLTSSKLALEGEEKNDKHLTVLSRINEVKNGILNLLEVQKEQILIKSTAFRFLKILEEAEALIRFKLNTLKMPAKILDEKLEQFKKSVEVMKNEKDEFDILMEGKVKQLKDFVSAEAEKLGNTLVKNIKTDFSDNLENNLMKIRNADLNNFQIEYFKIIQSEFDEMKEKLEKEVIERFKNLLRKYGDGSNSFLSELMNNLTDLSDFKFDSLTKVFNLDIYTGFYYNFSAEPIPLGLNNINIRKKMPKSVLRKTILNKILQNFIERINSNTANVKYDINYRIQESFLKFKYDLNQKLDSLLKNLEDILKQTISDKQKAESEIEEELNMYDVKLKKIEQIKSAYIEKSL